MLESLLPYLCCPVTRTALTLEVFNHTDKILDGKTVAVINDAVLYSEKFWFYPVIHGIPRLTVEAPEEYAAFLSEHVADYKKRREAIEFEYPGQVAAAEKKNRRTKESFTMEWSVYDHKTDNTWNAKGNELVDRFLIETGMSLNELKDGIMFDAGCGNGDLNIRLGTLGVANIAMDFSMSIHDAYQRNQSSCVHFIMGDVQFPPVTSAAMNLVYCSGVLIHTNDTAFSFRCVAHTVSEGGNLCVWLYHRRKNIIHRSFNFLRSKTSRLPLKVQYQLYKFTLLPASYIIKKLKGNKQSPSEMMVEILDWFTPEFRWEHSTEEASGWYADAGFIDIKVTTSTMFGFSITGRKRSLPLPVEKI